MANITKYINKVRNTASPTEYFWLRDRRLDTGEDIKSLKDWNINDPESFKYINNRTHYINSRFGLVNPFWDGSFVSSEAPEYIEIQNIELGRNDILYKISNTPLSSEEYFEYNLPEDGETALYIWDDEEQKYRLAANDEQATHVRNYKNLKTTKVCVQDLPTRIDTLEELYGPDLFYDIEEPAEGEYITTITYGKLNDDTGKYRVYLYSVEEDSVLIEGDQDTNDIIVHRGVYAYVKDFLAYYSIIPISLNETPIELDEQYIPARIRESIDGVDSKIASYLTDYYTKAEINQVVNGIDNDKMDKNNPIGVGDFYLLKNSQDQGGSINVAQNIFTNYEPVAYWKGINDNGTYAFVSILTPQDNDEIRIVDALPEASIDTVDIVYQTVNRNKVATETWVTTQLATKMNSNKYQFDQLQILKNGSYENVAAISDIPAIEPASNFKGYYAYDVFNGSGNWRPSGEEGDYIYVWNQYVSGMDAAATKYEYTNNDWTATQINFNKTFSKKQWKNINEADNYINELQLEINNLTSELEELKEQCEAMFEFAEGQDF